MIAKDKLPNIIIMYADDLGYGDLECYGATKIPTPNLNRFALQSIKFTEGHSAAATCTPARYSLLTGIYPWRNKKAHILPGDAPLIIDPEIPTLPQMLKDAGYRTGVVGKWHLGLGNGPKDWNKEINHCPLDVGFDSSFIMAATNDRVPCVFIDGRKVVGIDENDPIEVSYSKDNPFPELPTGRDNPELLRYKHSHGHDNTIVNGVGRIGFMRGGSNAIWVDEEMADTFLGKAIEFVKENNEKPFFLYYALHQPHVPRLPGSRFDGITGLGPRGDVIAEMDWCVGQLLDVLESEGLSEDTIVIFSSDNGPVLDDGYIDQAVELRDGHSPAGSLRGGKYSLFDGGCKVPFMLRWPEKVTPGESSALVCQIDLYASLASLTGQKIKPGAAGDSQDVLRAFLGNDKTGRIDLVTEGINAKVGLRQQNWKYIPPNPGPSYMEDVGIETGNSMEGQLYDLSSDAGQQHNLIEEHPLIALSMAKRLEEILRT